MKVIINHNIKYVFLVLFITGISSCKKSFLEINPKGKLIAENLLDYQRLLYNAPIGADYASGANMDGQVPLGDEIAAVEPYFQGVDFGFVSYDPVRMQRLFRWDDEVYQPEQDAYEMGMMKTIYLYNKVINEVGVLTDGNEQDRKTLIAQAKASRAWTYFLIINYYGKPYNETTAATDPGFPIILAADVTQTSFTRATVKEVYDFIIEDLTTSFADLPDRLTNRMIMSKPTAEALLGKVYIFMGKFDDALPLLNASLEGLESSDIPAVLYDYNITFGAGGEFMPVGLFGPTYPSAINNTEVVYNKQFVNYWNFTNSEFVINPHTVSLYNSSDLRLNFYSSFPFMSFDSYPDGMLRRIGPTATQFGVILPDLYLLRAECKTRLDDLIGGRDDVEALRVKRMPPADATVPNEVATDKEALVKFILEERTREFAVQGYRWFDMRRLSVDPIYSSTINTTHTLYNEDGSTTNFTLKPERYVFRFAQKLLKQNPGMENNP